MVIPVDESTPLAPSWDRAVNLAGSLSDIGTHYPSLLEDAARPGWLRRHPLPCTAGDAT